jgi:hypothetical protein
MKKAVTNLDYLFTWNSPKPISGTPVLSYVGPVAQDYSLVSSRADLSVTAIANDRRTLTLSAPADPLQADQIRAHLITATDGIFSVTVVRVSDTTAILAEPLPREIDLSTASTLDFALWSVTIPAAQMTPSNTYAYHVSYVADLGQYTADRVDKGAIKATPRPFDTGLDHDALVRIIPVLADKVPRRQADFTPQIQASLNELVLKIRDQLSVGLTEDEIFNAQDFALAHAYCAGARIFESALQMTVAEEFRTRCEELLHSALRSVSLDLNGDGTIDSGEINLTETGGSPRDFRASWSSYTKTNYDKTFTPKRAMRH